MPTLNEWKDIAAIAQGGATLIAIVVGGIWALRRYYRNAEHRANPAVHLQACFLGRHGDAWIVEVTVNVENKGKSPYAIHALTLTTTALFEDDGLSSNSRRHGSLKFQHELSQGSFLYPDYISIVDPGTTTAYTQLSAVASKARFVTFSVKLEAPGSGLSHYYVERTFPVGKAEEAACQNDR